MIKAGDSEVEATWIGSEISTIKANAPEAEIAILYRTNAQSRAIEQSLISENIGYQIFGGLKFYDRKEVKDVIAAIKMVANPQDGGCKDRLEKSLGKRRTVKVIEAIKTARPDMASGDLIKLFMEEGGYFSFLQEKFDNVQERVENIAELIAFSSQFTSLEEFLERVALLESTDAPRSRSRDENAVVLMTIHMAKGLEFDYVFLVGVNEGVLPHEKSMNSEVEVEEEKIRQFFLYWLDVVSRIVK